MMMETRIEYTNTRTFRHVILDHVDGPARGFHRDAGHPTTGRYTAAGNEPGQPEAGGHARRGARRPRAIERGCALPRLVGRDS